MLSYQHGYHAGNFADVHKHTALCLLLKHYRQSPKLVTYIDSHSGRGLYNLNDLQAQKTSEYKDGIERLLKADLESEGLRLYLEQVKHFEEGIYPGSPALMQAMMPANHRGLFFELHPAEYEELNKNLRTDNRLRVVQENAEESLINYLPARKSEGLLLIDPSYEIKEEYQTIARLALSAHKRWAQACIVVWYPLLPEARHEELKAALRGATFYDLIGPAKERGMYGTGLALFNAPQGFEDVFRQAEEEMHRLLWR